VGIENVLSDVLPQTIGRGAKLQEKGRKVACRDGITTPPRL
jgi:hypothetical protein